MDINIKLILNRKKAGIDCTEEESAEIKGYLREFKFPFEQTFVADIQELFPIEYGEFLNEEEVKEELEHQVKNNKFTVDIETGGLNYDAILIPVLPMDNEEDRLAKFKRLMANANYGAKPEIPVCVIGMGAPDEIYRRRIEAGLMPSERQYTRQDMINFANKAIYAYIGNALIVDSRLKLNAEWINDNLNKS